MSTTCFVCKKQFDDNEIYEYRGEVACDEHFDEMIEARDRQRNGIMAQEDAKTKPLKGLDLSGSVIGVANKKLLAAKIEVASKESFDVKRYEGRS